MSSWRKSSSMRPATRRARTGRRRSTFTTRVSEPWKCQKSRHQWKNEKTVQPKLYRSLFPHDVFLSGASFCVSSFFGAGGRTASPRTKKHAAGMFFAACGPPFCSSPTVTKNSSVPTRGRRNFGAGGRTRTGTPSLAVDFESTTSTNSITPALPGYYTAGNGK